MNTRTQHHARGIKALYVRLLLVLLPVLLSIFRHASKRIRTEIGYLPDDFTFMLSVRGKDLACACQKTASGSFRRVKASEIASDVEPGSGLASANPSAVTIDYVIDFRSLNYAFDCFSGGLTLTAAFAQRAFSTRGSNDYGVALTYMFSALLRMFFGWRTAWRKPAYSSN